jgi:hypothetical protein
MSSTSGPSAETSGDLSAIRGRKVFFLYPTVSIQNQVISELFQQEYEVYVAKNHHGLSNVLRKYTDSIVFVNVDEGMPATEWERWISGMKTTLPDLKFGVFSSHTDDEFKDKFLNELRVECGYMVLKLDMSKSISVILEILQRVDAKGRRKYIRADTEREANATLNIPRGNDYMNGIIKDISVVGISCSFEQDPGLPKNAVLKDIQIKLQSMLLKVEAIVFGSRMDCHEKIYVLLFTQRINPDVRTKIRKYIQTNLQAKMDQELK